MNYADNADPLNEKVDDLSNQIKSVIELDKEKRRGGTDAKVIEVVKDGALEKDMKIMHNYVKPSLRDIESSKETKELQKTQRCPNCGQFIKISEWRQHYSLCMADKKAYQE